MAGTVGKDQARVDVEDPATGLDRAGKAARFRRRLADDEVVRIAPADGAAPESIRTPERQGERVRLVLRAHVEGVPGEPGAELDGPLGDVDRELVMPMAVPVRPLPGRVEERDRRLGHGVRPR